MSQTYFAARLLGIFVQNYEIRLPAGNVVSDPAMSPGAVLIDTVARGLNPFVSRHGVDSLHRGGLVR